MNEFEIMFGFGDDEQLKRKPSKSNGNTQLDDPFYLERATGHSAHAIVRKAEHDAFVTDILGDDEPVPTPINTNKVASQVNTTVDSFLKTWLDDLMDPAVRLQKMRSAVRVQRTPHGESWSVAKNEGDCTCRCAQCQAGDCRDCSQKDGCAFWHDQQSQQQPGVASVKAAARRHIKNLSPIFTKFVNNLERGLGRKLSTEAQECVADVLANAAVWAAKNEVA